MYTPKDYQHLLGTHGFSDPLLKNHFKLYEGYVKNTNTLLDRLTGFIKHKKELGPEYAELKRRLGWEFNGMRLHEYYFGNMKRGAAPLRATSKLRRRIADGFGSFELWEQDFKATGTMRGIGWAILSYDPTGRRFCNTWITEHDVGHLAGTTVVLVLDVFEHAFITDYGLEKPAYIDAFFSVIDWNEVERRLAVSAAA